MTSGAPGWMASTAVRLYSLVLRLYPADFQARCAAPMLRTFEELCVTAGRRRTRIGFVRECAAEIGNAVTGAWRARHPERVVAFAVQEPASRDGRLAAVAQDGWYALRRLAAQPALVTFTVLTLGFAIAANAALFSIVDAVLLRPSPFRAADELMHLMNVSRRGSLFSGLTTETLQYWRTERTIFDAVEAYRETSVVVTGGLEPEEIKVAYLSPGLLATLGVAPRHGRLFTHLEGARGSDRVVILSEPFWRSRFGADPAVVGRQLSVNGQPHDIVGVMPRRFHFPEMAQQLWLPLNPDAASSEETRQAVTLVRLAPGLTAPVAQQRINATVDRLNAERPILSGWAAALAPGGFAGPDDATRRAVLILFGAVALVLLTACANVANLLLSRAVDRQREFTIRLVLGASRWRLFRELLLEGLFLGLAAGAAGLLVARWAIETLVRLAPDTLLGATRSGIAVDARVTLFGISLAIVTGILCNVPPALRTFRARAGQTLSGRTRTATATPLQRRLRGSLVVLEISLAVVLLVGAALMIRSFLKLNAVDIGFNPDKLLAVSIGLDSERYQSDATRFALLQRVAKDASELPGVSGVAVSSGMPPNAGTMALGYLETPSGACDSEPTSLVANLVSANYFSLLGIRVADGRPLRDADPPYAVVVSASVARRCGAASLTGQRLRLAPTAAWMTVVGTAVDVKTRGLTAAEGEMAIYLPTTAGRDVFGLVADLKERRVVPRYLIVGAERPSAVLADIKRILWSHDAGQPVLGAATASELMADTIRRERFLLTLMTLFSAVTLALASAGIFGVLAYSVAQRANEFGIRMALGATTSHILRLVVGHGVLLAAAGASLGLAFAYAFSRVLSGLLFEVHPHDPVVFMTIPAVVFLVALLAAWLPTVRALRVDPASALRVD